jgi:integrase
MCRAAMDGRATRRVAHSAARVRGRGWGVKSSSAARTLPLSPTLTERLQVLPRNGPYIFAARNGAPLNPGNWLKREVRPKATALGLQLGGWHDFRHATATRLRKHGVHPRVVASILGHSKVQLAMEVYDHVDQTDMAAALQLHPNAPKGDVEA